MWVLATYAAAAPPPVGAGVPPAASPIARLDALLPGLGEAVAARTDAPEPVAALLEAADPSLVRLLLPFRGPVEDAAGEVDEVDLHAAEVHRDGSVVWGEIRGRGVARHGAWLHLDTKGGPAPDLQLGVGAGWLRSAPMSGWTYGPTATLAGESVVDGDAVRFRVDLGEPSDHAGSGVAYVRGLKETDYGPAGALGPVEAHALDALLALMSPRAGEDPDLTVAVALAFGPWRGLVAPDVVPLVEEDAAAWLAYGLGVDTWLEAHGAAWRLRSQPAAAKLLWAWPGAQSFAYGAFPIATQAEPLTRDRYRFVVPSVDTLVALRDMLPIWPSAWDTAVRRDDVVWAKMRYRASAEAMRTLCAAGEVRENECRDWEKEQASGFHLGEIDGVRIATDLGVSASLQVDLEATRAQFYGDCATAVAIATAAYQAVGLVPMAVGYAGASFDWPTHDFPLYLEGDRFVSPQGGPHPDFRAAETYAYVVVPALDPVLGTQLATARTGWAHGAAIAGGHLTYGEVERWVAEGIPLETVFGWVVAAYEGRWTEF
ncbi:MAG: hypothetical protein ACOZNI_36220 [Myxococcota bacterium]